MKKARVIVTYECERNCSGCCNKDADGPKPTVLENLEHLIGYDEIMITGGEPLLFMPALSILAIKLKILSRQSKLYIYTAETRKPNNVAMAIGCSDGICLTLHTQEDADMFKPFMIWGGVCGLIGKSMRLNIFKGVKLDDDEPIGWKTKRDIEWIKNCPLPDNEELFVIRKPWRRI